MKVLCSTLALFLSVGLVATSVAGEGGKCTAGKSDSASAKAACHSKGEGSAKACASKCSAPCMKFQVGDETVCCPKKADELAKGDKSKITYLVAGKEFSKQEEAYTAYATELNRHLEKITSVAYMVGDESVSCPVSAKDMASKSGKAMKYAVGPASYESKEEAEKVAKAAKEAADKVAMKVMCEGKEIHCNSEAKEGQKVEYVVGETKSCCKTMASAELAKAKIEAAMKAIAPQTAGV